jgi:hypothetical protein
MYVRRGSTSVVKCPMSPIVHPADDVNDRLQVYKVWQGHHEPGHPSGELYRFDINRRPLLSLVLVIVPGFVDPHPPTHRREEHLTFIPGVWVEDMRSGQRLRAGGQRSPLRLIWYPWVGR